MGNKASLPSLAAVLLLLMALAMANNLRNLARNGRAGTALAELHGQGRRLPMERLIPP